MQDAGLREHDVLPSGAALDVAKECGGRADERGELEQRLLALKKKKKKKKKKIK
jgi:hypothetical protein